MKTHLIFFIILCCLLGRKGQAQSFIYNYSIGEIYEKTQSGNGIVLPDGTKVKVEFIRTTPDLSSLNPQMGPDMFKTGNNNVVSLHYLGGTFNGNILPAFQGSNDAAMYTTIQAKSGVGVHNGRNNNFEGSVGLRLHFSKPTVYADFLFLDIDGKTQLNNNGNPTNFGNQEWSTVFAFNDTQYVPMTIKPNNAGNGGSYLTFHPALSIANGHSWRKMLRDIFGNSLAENNFPASYENIIQHTAEPSAAQSGDQDPDLLENQFRVFPTVNDAQITDFFVLWGVASNLEDPQGHEARSGMSPVTIKVKADFGDAPVSYKTKLNAASPNQDGPSHGVVSTLMLGNGVTPDLDGQPNNQAKGESDPNGDDGVSTFPSLIINQQISSYTITTSFKNTTGKTAHFMAWLDKNENGQFDQSEAVAVNSDASSGNVSFTWTNFTIEGSKAYVRIRVTTQNITATDDGGAFIDGEVEDYRIDPVPLPVNLVSFTGKESDTNVKLHWTTTFEKDFSHFEIMKSRDAKDFKSIGALDGSGRGSYDFTDHEPADGNNYYRLKMVDKDGSFEFSRVISVNFELNKTFLLVENPTRGGNLEVISNAKDPVFEMFKSSGARVKVAYSIGAGANHYTLSLNRPASGLYILKMICNGKVLTRKIIIP